ncbi:Drug/Metabolite transporter superfamily, partial [Micromonas commoda]
KSLKIALVCSDCLLVSFQPLLVHLSKSADGTFAFDPISVNLLVECVKCVFAVCFIVYTANQPSPEAKALRSVSRLRRAARENLPLAFPSALHAVNNYLKFAMQLYFSPTTVRMLANLKVLVIAVLLKTITRRRFSVIQWEALALLVLGVTVNQMKLSLGAGGAEDAAMSPMALMYTAMFISFPSFASVFNEVTMKKNFETSVSLQMFFSYFWGAVFNLIGLFGVGVYRSWNGGSEGWMPSVFRGHSIVTCLLVANNAAQGVLSTFFFKFADSVMKKHSSNAATIFTALLSAAMFGHTLRANFVVGGAIVLISMHLFYA